jgi:hypothetical protein
MLGNSPYDWFWEAEERHQQHDEKKRKHKADDLATVSVAKWLALYGRRNASVWGSAEMTT